MPVRGHPGVSVDCVPNGLHRHQPQIRNQESQGSRRQAHRRAALYDDRGDLHQRHPQERVRRRSVEGALGAKRDEYRGRARQSDRAAVVEENFAREQYHQQNARRAPRRRCNRRHARHQLPNEIRTNPDVVRLFPNYVDVDKDLYKRKKIYPIMHLVAIRKSVYERYPFVVTSLYDAFAKSKQIALAKLFNLRAVRYMTPFLMREIDDILEVFNGDPWPYGVEPNRKTLEALVQYQQDLGLIDRPVKVDELFVPVYG